jgi:signal transduction histidine kinase/AmiR/NasT family two-component response regulator
VIKPRPDAGSPVGTADAGLAMPLSTTTRKAFAARRPRLPAWFGPVVAAALIALSMAALWFNGVLPLFFFAALVLLLHLLLNPAQALWATTWVLAWPAVTVPEWLQAGQMPQALSAWAGALLVGLMSQFVVRLNRRFCDEARHLVDAMAMTNRDLRDAEQDTRAARERAEGLATDLARQLGGLQAERDRARAAQEQAEHERKRAQDALVQNLLLEHEQDRLSRLLHSSTEAMSPGLMVLDPWGRIEFANRRVWTLLGVDASMVNPAHGLAGLLRQQLAMEFFGRKAAAVLTRALHEYEQWLAEVTREGPQITVPSVGPFAGVALHDLRLFRGWPMIMTPEGKLEEEADVECLTGEPPPSAPGSAHPVAVAYHSRAISGLTLHVQSSALPNGGIVRLYTDVSDLVRTAEALGRSLADLRAKDAQLQAEVLHSRSEVELNNRFVASVSHEIRTAVQGIAGIATMLGQPVQGRVEASLVRDLESSAQDLTRLSEDLLSLARLRRARFSFEPGVFDPAAMIERCLQLVSPRANASKASVEHSLGVRIPLLLGDEQRVAQVVTNLLQNAAKFAPHGRIRVDAWLEEYEDASDPRACELHVRVADTGRGIPFGLVGRVFEPFDQGEESTNRDHGGTGLGLALSLELCEAMDGGIGVFSRPGVGSVFEMRVRLLLAEDLAANLAPAGPQAGTADSVALHEDSTPLQEDGSPPMLGGMRVLVVDDNRLNRKLMSMWIAAQGAAVETAADGQEGVRLALASDFDCVLMDMSMPVMNGLDAARAIRKASSRDSAPEPASDVRLRRAHVPLIGVTAMARREDRQLCLAAGMDAHLAKPVRRQALTREIRRVIAARAWLSPPHRPAAG